MGSSLSCHQGGKKESDNERPIHQPRTLQTLIDSVADPQASAWLASVIDDPPATPLAQWIATVTSAALLKNLSDATQHANLRSLYAIYRQSGSFAEVYLSSDSDWQTPPNVSAKTLQLLPVLSDPATGLLATLGKLVGQVENETCPAPRAPSLKASKCLTNPMLYLLAMASAHLNSVLVSAEPTLLFSIDTTGHSWIRFVESIDGYPAPVLLVMKSKPTAKKGSNVFGAYIPGGVNETATKYAGDPETFLYGFHPEVNFCAASGLSSKYVLLNRQSQFAPTGLGFGGQPGAFRFFLSSDLHTATICLSDATYKAGPIADMTDKEYGDESFQVVFPLDEIEVYGLGTQADLDVQSYAKQRDEGIRADRRQVDRAKFAESTFDREFLLGQGAKGHERAGEVQQIVEERRRAKEEE